MQFTSTIAAAISVVLGTYFVAVRMVTESFRRLSASDQAVDLVGDFLPVTVVVPFRDEQENLPALIRALKRQDFKGPLEIVFSDDHSADGSSQLVREAGFRLIALPDGRIGKKAALDHAIRQSSNVDDGRSLILTTDADVVPAETWVSAMAAAFSDDSVKMVLGPVTIRPDGWWCRVQAMEFAPVMAVTAVAAAAGVPLMANGANLAFRTKDFLDADGYAGNEHIASGDDQFLLSNFRTRWPGSIRFAFDRGAVVTTAGQSTWGGLIAQRVRWAGKWSRTGSLSLMMTALLVFVVQLSTVGSVLLAFRDGFEALLLLLPVRWMAEYFLILAVRRFFGFPVRLHEFILLAAVYPLYVFAIALRTLGPHVQWKGRRV